MMNLNNFEGFIDKKILSRGEAYYIEGNINSVEKVDDCIYRAKVHGTDIYTVEVELDNQNDVIDTFCDCPYDLGEYCKHQVAVLLYLRDKLASEHMTNVSNKDTCQHKLPQDIRGDDNVEPDIHKLLSKYSKNEIIDFLALLAEEQEVILDRIVLRFSQTDDEEDIKNAKEIIRSYIHIYSGRGGYIDYRDVSESIRGAEIVLDKIESVILQGRLLHATNLTLCVLRIMIDLIQSADDSDGFIGNVIYTCIDYLKQIVDCKDMTQEQKVGISKEVLQEACNKRFDGWTDWRFDLIEQCSKLADISSIRNKIETHLEKIHNKNNDSRSCYYEERIALIRLNFIERNDRSVATHNFIYENLNIPAIRRRAITDAMDEKDFNQVISLTKLDEKNEGKFPGRISEWKEFRYEAYYQSGMLKQQRELAMEFVFNGSFEYYLKLKNTYTVNEWRTIYPDIINDLEKRKGYYYFDNYTRILIEEGENHRLLGYVQNNPSSVETYYKYLIPEFKSNVYEVFMQYIEKSAAEANNRKQYQRVCSIIKSLKKAGGKEEAEVIKARLYNKYANRPALRDELSRVLI